MGVNADMESLAATDRERGSGTVFP